MANIFCEVSLVFFMNNITSSSSFMIKHKSSLIFCGILFTLFLNESEKMYSVLLEDDDTSCTSILESFSNSSRPA